MLGPRSPLDEPTTGERVVLGHMAAGLSNAAIAREMVVTERTVESPVRWLLQDAEPVRGLAKTRGST